jgi:hypothetical protein
MITTTTTTVRITQESRKQQNKKHGNAFKTTSRNELFQLMGICQKDGRNGVKLWSYIWMWQ